MRVSFKVVQERGNGDFAWHTDGKRIIVGGGGSDGTLQLITPNGDAKEKRVVPLKASVIALSLSPSGTQICVSTRGNDGRTVRTLDVPSLDPQDILVRTPLDVLHVAYSPTGSIVACGGEDGSVLLANAIAPQTSPLKCQPPHSGPILGVAFDPLNAYVASTGADGDGCVFDTTTGNRVSRLPSLFPRVPPSGADSLPPMTPSWRPDGSAVAFPAGKDIACFGRGGDWSESFRLSGGHSRDVSGVSWSKNGRYLVSFSSADGVAIVWDAETKESIHRTKAPLTPLCSALWNPDANSIAMLDAHGQLGIWEDVIPKSMPAPNRPLPAVTTAQGTTGQGASSNAAMPSVTAVRALPPSDIFTPAEIAKAEEEAALAESREEARRSKERQKQMPEYATPIAQPLQEAFQPSSSTFEKRSRFLVYNGIGSVVSKEQGVERVLVVEYADQSRHSRSVSVDRHKCLFGSLSDRGIAVANPHFVVFQASSPEPGAMPSCDWVRQLPEDETALGIACNDVAVCVPTSRRFLRLFSLVGMQQSIVAVPGAHLTIAGRGNSFTEVYHSSSGQIAFISFVVSENGSARMTDDGMVPVSVGSSLSWVGITELGSAAVLDSAGLLYVRVLGQEGSRALWFPMLDFAPLRRSGESHWPIDVTRKEVLCVSLRNGDVCPATAPAPLIDSVPLTPPLIAESTAQDTALCVQMVRDRAVLDHRIAVGAIADPEREIPAEEAQLDVCLLKVIQSALRSTSADDKRDQRILGMCRVLTMRKSLAIAAKYASAAGMSRLAETIAAMFEDTSADASNSTEKKRGAADELSDLSKKKSRS